MYREAFWVAVAAAAPVIALAAAVAISDTVNRFGEIFESLTNLLPNRDLAGTDAEFDEINSTGATAVRFMRIAALVGMLNILVQAVVLAFSLTSLASGTAELSPVVVVIGEVAGVAAVASAALVSAVGVMYMYTALHKAWELLRAQPEKRPANRRLWWRHRSPGK